MLNKKAYLGLIILISSTLVSAMQKPQHPETKKPNIIFIMSDDVGFEEIGCYGVLDG